MQTAFARTLFFIVLLSLGAGAYFYFKQSPEMRFFTTQLTVEEPEQLQLGKRYRIFVKSIVVPPKDDNGDKWDAGDKTSAPDVFFRVINLDNMIYESTTIDDVLVAEFEPVKGGLIDAITVKNISEYLECADIAYRDQNSQFSIQVIDEDTFDNDDIGSVLMKLKDLQLGSNKFKHGNVSYVINIIDADADINKTLKDLELIR